MPNPVTRRRLVSETEHNMGLTNYEQVWEQNRQAGEKALRLQQLGSAEEHYRMTVVLAELLWPKSERHAECLTELGSVYLAEGEAGKAQPFLERALAILSEIRGTMDPALIPTLECYTRVLRKTHRRLEAENLERRLMVLKRRAGQVVEAV